MHSRMTWATRICIRACRADRYDAERYDAVVEACCLGPDFESFPRGTCSRAFANAFRECMFAFAFVRACAIVWYQKIVIIILKII